LAHLRGWLHDQGVCSSVDLRSHDTTRRVWLAGLVTHRQRPATAGGVTFLNLEDEWGLVNVVCSQGLWKRYRLILRHSGALIVRGTLQRSNEGVMSVVADGVSQLAVGAAVRARNFQ
jgi:error-prone DNA polymerase